VLIAKYKVRGNWINQKGSSNDSRTWKSLNKAKQILALGACKKVGDDTSILVWEDLWVPGCLGFVPKPKNNDDVQMSLVVSHLLNHQREGWDEQKLNNIFDARQSKKSQSVFVLKEIDGFGLL
jgi:hypothetical protein